MLCPPSAACRGIGASGAVRLDSTMTSRKAHASPVTRPAPPVQVRVTDQGSGSRTVWKTWIKWHEAKYCLHYTFNPVANMLVSTSGAGFEACNHCAEEYLVEERRCVASCSAGFYATKLNPEIADGHRICRRWALWCVFRCGWFVYLLMAGLIMVAGFSVCNYLCFSSHLDLFLWLHGCSSLSYVLGSVFCAVLLRCDASCLTCAGPSWGNCSSCSRRRSLLDGVCVDNTECTDGQSTIFSLTAARLICWSFERKFCQFPTCFGDLKPFYQ